MKADHTPTSQRGMRLRWQRREAGRLARMLEKRELKEKREVMQREAAELVRRDAGTG